MKKMLFIFCVLMSMNGMAADFCTIYTDKFEINYFNRYRISSVCSGSDSMEKEASDWKEARSVRAEIIKSLLDKGYEIKSENNLSRK